MIRCPNCRAVNEDGANRCHVCESMMLPEAPVRAATPKVPPDVAARMDDPRWRFGPESKDVGPRYVLVEKLGRGGMGVVWKAWDLRLRRYAAIKLIQGAFDDRDVEQFVREARVVAGLRHPNIAQVYDVEEGEQPYIVMELVEGRTLAEDPPRDPREVARVVLDASRGLRHAHAKSVVHQDVKPENVMVTSDEERRVLVMDFGVALLGRGTMQQYLTLKDQGAGGTPAFMSPEQAAGRLKEIDARSDVYGLGATMYALLAGKAPFSGDSVQEILQKVAHETPEPLAKARPEVPPELVRIVEKAMARERDGRYASMTEFGEDLARFLGTSAATTVEKPCPCCGKPVRPEAILCRHCRASFVPAPAPPARSGIPGWAIALIVAVIAVPVLLVVIGAGAMLFLARREPASASSTPPVAPETKPSVAPPGAVAGVCVFTGNPPARRKVRGNPKCPSSEHAPMTVGSGLGDAVVWIESWDRGLRTPPPPVTIRGCLLTPRVVVLLPGDRLAVTNSDPVAHRIAVLSGGRRTEFEIGAGQTLEFSETGDFRLQLDPEDESVLQVWRLGQPGAVITDGTGEFRFAAVPAGRYTIRARHVLLGEQSQVIEVQDGATREVRFVFEPTPALEAESEYRAGRDAILQARFAEAVLHFTWAIVLDASDPAKWFHRGAARRALGDIEGAIVDLTQAIVLRPDFVEALLLRGSCRRERREDPRSDYDRAIELRPGEPDAWYLRGHYRSQSGDAQGALADFEKALALYPPESSRRSELEKRIRELRDPFRESIETADAHLRKGEWEKAKKVCQEILQKQPGDSRARERLRQAKRRLGEFELIRTLTGHTSAVAHVALSPDQRTLASASWDRTARLWEYSSGKSLHTLTQGDWLDWVSFSPDGSLLATGGGESHCRIWEVASGKERTRLPHTRTVATVAFGPSGRLATGCYDQTARIWDWNQGRELRSLSGHTNTLNSIDWSSDGRTLATASSDGSVRLWDSESGALQRTLSGHANAWGVAFSPNERVVITTGQDSKVLVWDSSTGAQLRTLSGHTDGVCTPGVSADGALLASPSWDKTVRIWDLATGQCLRTLEIQTGKAFGAVFTRDGMTLVTGAEDGIIRVWSIKD